MARPTRTNADYFYHPADFRNDRRVGAIRARLGLAGYGLLLMLLEVLTDAHQNRLDPDEVELELLAGDLHVEAEELTSLIALAEKVRLFARTADNLLHCPQLDEWLAPVYEKRDRVKLAQQSRRSPIPATGNGNNPQAAETTPIISETTGIVSETTPPVEYSKEQYSREDSIESSSVELALSAGAGEPEKKKEDSAALPAPTPAPSPPVARPPRSPALRAAGTYRAYDDPWPEQLHPPFETPAFHAAWAKWGTYLAELEKPHRGHTHEAEDLLKLSRLAAGDHAQALAIISESISAGWKSLNLPTHATNRRNDPRRRPAADPAERLNLPGRVSFAEDAA